ncbi:uncharacterized protein LOC105642006 [Jatropha curcas]|uniref:uncharacterized protein LOC105642006 n=1 Tax=Jatropha curcas TaxID=180498 RepID=UPI001894E292|nr:uncharacterized protein LOC105642006 [Jatropha curcas]
MAATQVLTCNNGFCSYSLVAATIPYKSKPSIFHHYQLHKNKEASAFSCNAWPRNQKNRLKLETLFVCQAARRKPSILNAAVSSDKGDGDNARKVLQIILWALEGVYILWLFLLPYAPVSICFDIVNNILFLINLSLDWEFETQQFKVEVFAQSDLNIELFGRVVGISLIDAPVLHPMSEGLFNFVIGWTFMFAPLLFSDCRRDRYKGSLDILWGLQMFLTNTFLIPYMAIRLNEADSESTPQKLSQLGTVMTNGAPIVGLIGGFACLISALWALYGRMDGNFGSITDRWEFLVSYLGSERLAYAFIWDICLYIIFQPWLIGDNLQNVQKSRIDIVKYLRFVPVVGLVAYLLCLNLDEEL